MRRPSIRKSIGLSALLTMAALAQVSAQNFALQVGPPIAGAAPSVKKSLMVVRPSGCANPADARISATAEGLVGGARQSVPVELAALSTPGVHAVSKSWPNGGVWVVNLTGTCAGKTAGALVSIGPDATYHRDRVQHLAHRATPEEIEASLKALATGGRK
jgi:hypothetical protein